MAQSLAGTVYSVDPDRVTRARLAQVLDGHGIKLKTFDSAERFLKDCRAEVDGSRDTQAYQPACLLLEVALPGVSGFDLQAALAAAQSTLPIIFLAATSDPRIPIQALRAGAADFLLKPMEPAALASGVGNALTLDAHSHQERARRARIRSRMAQLTQREAEVMAHVVRGRTSREIAEALCISPRTVEVHRKNLFSKMCADSVAGLVEQAIAVREAASGANGLRVSIFSELRDSTYLTRAGNV